MPLPVPPDVMRVRLRATLQESSVPQDEAQFGFWLQRVHETGTTVDWPADVQSLAERIRDMWVEHITGKGLWSNAVHMASCTVDHLKAADGTVLDQGVAPFDGASAWTGSGDTSLPWETSLAVSLYGYLPGTFARDKARRRGRMYLPPFAVIAMGGTAGQLGAGNLSNLNTQVGAFFNDVQGMHFYDGPTAGNDTVNLVIVSRGTPVKPLPPTCYDVIQVRMDSKVDSQRRRERQQPATSYYFTPITR